MPGWRTSFFVNFKRLYATAIAGQQHSFCPYGLLFCFFCSGSKSALQLNSSGTRLRGCTYVACSKYHVLCAKDARLASIYHVLCAKDARRGFHNSSTWARGGIQKCWCQQLPIDRILLIFFRSAFLAKNKIFLLLKLNLFRLSHFNS